MLSTTTVIRSIQTGRIAPLGAGKHTSAIVKRQATGSVLLTPTGLAGDEQADKRHHGGEEMALHHYPFDHYAAWRRDYPERAERFAEPGSFGENITTLGMTEETVCVGDIYLIGEATVQVSQGRQPCWKLNVRFELPDFAVRVQETGRSGWYYRVLESGRIAAGDEIHLEKRPNPDWPIARVHNVLYKDGLNEHALRNIASIDQLSESWRRIAEQRLASRESEDWTSRLATPNSD